MARGGWHTGSSVLLMAAAAYFAVHAVRGEQSVLAWAEGKRTVAQSERDLAAARDRREALEVRARRLRLETLDLDYLDERARALASVARPGEVIAPPHDPAFPPHPPQSPSPSRPGQAGA